MLATVDDNSSALQSCILISRKPEESAAVECWAADGPVSARMQTAAELLLHSFWSDLSGADETRHWKGDGTFLYEAMTHVDYVIRTVYQTNFTVSSICVLSCA